MKSQIGIFVITLLFCSFLFVCYSNLEIVQGSTSVTGIISSDTEWTKVNSPYNLTGNVLVNNGVTLTIKPGVIVNINSYYIMVNGTLQVLGNSTDQIYINSGQITFTKNSTNWNESAGTGCIIEYSIIDGTSISSSISLKFSKNEITSESISFVEGSPVITNNTIFGGINVGHQSQPIISNNIIQGGGNGIGGIYVSNAIITDNIISDCGIGIELWPFGTSKVEGNFISGNDQGIQFYTLFNSGIGTPIVQNNTITNNSNGISFNIIGSYTINPIIQYNNIHTNDYNIYSSVSHSLNATNNWWGTTDTLLINQKIYDFNDNFNFGTVNYVPFLNESNPNAPTIPTFIISSSAGSGGSVSPSGSVSVVYGESQAFTIVASADYHILDVLVNGNSVGAVSSYTFNNIQTANTLSATFAPNPTPSPSPTPTPTATPIPTASPIPTPTATPSPSPTPSTSPTPTPTATPTPTPTATPTPTPEEPLMLSATPKSAIVTPNQKAYFTASASGGTSPYSYQWYEAGIEVIDGAVSTEFTISKSSVGSYSFYCNVTDSQGWNANTNNVVLTVIDNPTPPPSSTFSLPLEYTAVGIAAIVGIAVLVFLLKRK